VSRDRGRDRPVRRAWFRTGVIDGRRYTRHCAQEIHLVTFAVVLDSEGTEVDRVQIRSVPFTAPTKEHP
jgi:hypothetical protein